MTRARALKDVIRARAAKTGERYTTARRQILKALQPPATAVTRERSMPAPGAGADDNPAPSTPAAVEKSPSTPAATKGGLSDAKAREKTGHGLDHWFHVLDQFGGVEKGHTASARHLYETHDVPGWHAQGITVAYERARGVRAPNQRCDGEYEVSVSKVVPAGVAAVIAAFTDNRVRNRWVKVADAGLAKALAAAIGSPASKGIVTRPDGQGRFRYKWGDTTVQVYLLPKPGGKVSVVVTNAGLADAAMVEQRRTQWRTALDALARMHAPPKPRST